jgi:hypothetical protein
VSNQRVVLITGASRVTDRGRLSQDPDDEPPGNGRNRVSEYDRWRQRALRAIRAYEEKGPGPEAVAETLLEIISSSNPRLRYPIGQQAKTVARLRRFLPARMYEQGVGRTFSLDSVT